MGHSGSQSRSTTPDMAHYRNATLPGPGAKWSGASCSFSCSLSCSSDSADFVFAAAQEIGAVKSLLRGAREGAREGARSPAEKCCMNLRTPSPEKWPETAFWRSMSGVTRRDCDAPRQAGSLPHSGTQKGQANAWIAAHLPLQELSGLLSQPWRCLRPGPPG